MLLRSRLAIIRGQMFLEKGGFMKRLTLLVLFSMLMVPFYSAALAEGLKVGTLFDNSGALKDWGPRQQNAAELAAEQMAAAGFTIEFFHEDSQTAAEPAKIAARKLIATDKVAVIIGSSSSGVIVPVAESVTGPENVLMITPGATSPFITDLPEDKDKDFLFRTCPSDALQGAVLGRLAAGLYKTASVMYVNNAYGQGLANQFRRTFVKNGGIVYTMIPHSEVVAKSYAADLRNAYARMYSTKPFRSGRSDVLCAFSYPEQAKVYIKEAIEIYHAKHFLFCDGTKSEELAAAVGPEKLEGMFGTAPGAPAGEASLKFTADYTAQFGELPTSPFIANTYDAMAVIGLAAYAAEGKRPRADIQEYPGSSPRGGRSTGVLHRPGRIRKSLRVAQSRQTDQLRRGLGAGRLRRQRAMYSRR